MVQSPHNYSGFVAWMNRPSARAQVTVFQYALKVFKDALSMRFHCLPGYRDEIAKQQRQEIAARLKEIHHENGKSKLWRYEMETGHYTPL